MIPYDCPFPEAVDLGRIEHADEFIFMDTDQILCLDALTQELRGEMRNLQTALDLIEAQDTSLPKTIWLDYLNTIVKDSVTYTDKEPHDLGLFAVATSSTGSKRQGLHQDNLWTPRAQHMRYLLANKHPTRIKDLPHFSAGSVARITGDALHAAPHYNLQGSLLKRAQTPRFLFAADVRLKASDVKVPLK